ncbi:MAG: sigma 54-interacting transcriptional regulator [Myxococcales bacterium]|nr:sigma 54-interacting transcriptional regulator [Myxococcales bacterium]
MHLLADRAVDFYPSLLDIAKLVLREEGRDRTAEVLLQRVVELTQADRGFIVVHEGEAYEQRFAVAYDPATLTREHRRFSRSLVRLAIQSKEQVTSASVAADPSLAPLSESVLGLAGHAVLVTPLHDADEVYGVLYLERVGMGHFAADAQRFLAEVAEVGGLFLRRAVERDELRRQKASLEQGLYASHDFQGIVTQDPAMLDVLRTVAQVADADAPVLVRGETGTGKELVARALHVNGARRNKPFVALHCTALPGAILESELFGHVRGAFTGADKDRAGRIASAQGGTLFLDEVAEIPTELQAKLLRFLQFGEIQRLGSDRTEIVKVRVVAATHRDLGALVRDGRFRQDLYYRLNTVEVVLPPLRERRRDVALLLEHFLRRHWQRASETPRFTAAATRALSGYAWPGNVRELGHLVERACLLARGPELDVDLLPQEVALLGGAEPAGSGPFERYTAEELDAARQGAVAATEHEFLRGLMTLHGGNVSLAARSSGLHRTYLHKLLARHGIKPA